jgi:hypothetical protein
MSKNIFKKYRHACDECGCMDMVNVVRFEFTRYLCDECLPMWVEENDEEEYAHECNF